MIHTPGTNQRRRRPTGFTLIELMIVIAIIFVLSSMTLMTLAQAREDAKRSKTRAQILRLERIIQAKWEDYQFRSLPLNFDFQTLPTNWNQNIKLPPVVYKLYAMRETMRMEFPDRLTDFEYEPRNENSLTVNGYAPLATTNDPYGLATFLPRNPAVFDTYRRKIINSQGGRVYNEVEFRKAMALWRQNDPDGGYRYQGAECLYLIISSIQDEMGNAIDSFQTSVGDKDSDGMLEIHDAWGNPIEFIRWAPGYVDTGLTSNTNMPVSASVMDYVQIPDNRLSPDPFDPLQVDGYFPGGNNPNSNNKNTRWWLLRNENTNASAGNPWDFGYALFPLIYSTGPDGISDIVSEFEPGNPDNPYRCSATHYYAPFYGIANKSLGLRNDPYFKTQNQIRLGDRLDINQDGTNNSLDNIDNHTGVIQ